MLSLYRDVFKSLNDHDVKYLVIGGIAVGVHVTGRVTFDLDIIIEPTLQNATNLLAAFEDARIGLAATITPERLLENEITIFRDYVQVDVQTLTPGIDFARAWDRRETISHGDVSFLCLSREDLIASKKAAGRNIDIRDLEALGEELASDDDDAQDS